MTTSRTVATLLISMLIVACSHDIAPRSPERVQVFEQAPAPEPEILPGRTLTTGELALLRPVFGDSIDYAEVRIVRGRFAPFQSDDMFMTPRGIVYAPVPLYVDDFAAADTNPWRQAMYVHEMTHVWQHQRGIDVVAGALDELARTGGDYGQAYAYTLTPGRDLLDYSLEQAATIIEDWFLLRTHGLPPYGMKDPPASDAERDALYAGVLGAFLADPAYRR